MKSVGWGEPTCQVARVEQEQRLRPSSWAFPWLTCLCRAQTIPAYQHQLMPTVTGWSPHPSAFSKHWRNRNKACTCVSSLGKPRGSSYYWDLRSWTLIHILTDAVHENRDNFTEGRRTLFMLLLLFPIGKVNFFSEIWEKIYKKWEDTAMCNWKLLNFKILMELWTFNTTLSEKKKRCFNKHFTAF